MAARIRWSAERIAAELRPIVANLGRMPTANELRAQGKNALACAISRGIHGGMYAEWARLLGVPNAATETHRGQAIERYAKELLESYGFHVERQTARAPFDFLVDGCVRVDVKSGKFGTYGVRKVQAFIFHTAKNEPTCDLYMLVGVTRRNEPLWVYYVPAEHARVQTISISRTSKYARFKGAVHELVALTGRMEAAA